MYSDRDSWMWLNWLIMEEMNLNEFLKEKGIPDATIAKFDG